MIKLGALNIPNVSRLYIYSKLMMNETLVVPLRYLIVNPQNLTSLWCKAV